MSLKTWILRFICVHRFRGFMIFSLWGNDMICSIICSSHGCFGSYGSNGSHQFFFSPLLPCQGHQLLAPDSSFGRGEYPSASLASICKSFDTWKLIEYCSEGRRYSSWFNDSYVRDSKLWKRLTELAKSLPHCVA